MTGVTKPTFEFDPLPGDVPAASGPPTEAMQPAKGERKKREKKPKTERKKRGPRRVAPAALAVTAVAIDAAGAVTTTVAPVKPERKKRQPKVDLPPEYDFIKQMMDLTEPTRERVMAALQKVFG